MRVHGRVPVGGFHRRPNSALGLAQYTGAFGLPKATSSPQFYPQLRFRRAGGCVLFSCVLLVCLVVFRLINLNYANDCC